MYVTYEYVKTAGLLSLNRISLTDLGQRELRCTVPEGHQHSGRQYLRTSQVCHTRNRTDQHPEVTRQLFVFFKCLW